MRSLNVASAVGVKIAQVYVGYGVFLLVGTLLGIHALMVALTAYWLRPSPRFAAPALQWGVDIVYGFVNPLIYLVVLVASGPTWQKFPAVRIPDKRVIPGVEINIQIENTPFDRERGHKPVPELRSHPCARTPLGRGVVPAVLLAVYPRL